MKRTIKVNGRSYTFEAPRNLAVTVDATFNALAKSAVVAYKRKTEFAYDITGQLISTGQGWEAGSFTDTEKMSGKAALADVCKQLESSPHASEVTENQLAELLMSHDIDMSKAIVTA